jgi:putative mRNA 3-end processing factor
MTLLQLTDKGLYCAAGDFYIDPWRPVDFAVITHAHSDHARGGSRRYLAAESGRGVLQERLGSGVCLETLSYGKSVTRNGVSISLHPAGHILGSAQVRVEHGGEVWVVSGDYKLASDPTCAAFEPVHCHTFISECTFGLPIYRWRSSDEIFSEINAWWRSNQIAGRTSLLFGYSLGKAQRLLAGVDASIGPIFVHEAVSKLLPFYADAGVRFPDVQIANGANVRAADGRALVIGPSAADDSPWLRRFGAVSRCPITPTGTVSSRRFARPARSACG